MLRDLQVDDAVYGGNSIDYHKAKSEKILQKLKDNSEISRSVIASAIVENRIETPIGEYNIPRGLCTLNGENLFQAIPIW